MIWIRRVSFGGSSSGCLEKFYVSRGINGRVYGEDSLNRNTNHSDRSLRVRKGSKKKKAGRQFRRSKPAQAGSLSEQPVADKSGTVPCEICGLPVDRKRLQAHRIRFHGASHI